MSLRYKPDTSYYDYPPHMLRRTYLCAMRQGQLFACGICSNIIKKPRALTIDHIVPKSKGGSDNYENLQPAHKHCNQRKGDNEPDFLELQNLYA